MASLTAFLFGATAAMTIGPIALLIVNASAATGLGKGVSSACGAAIGDLTFALVAFEAGSFAMKALASHRDAVSISASLVLIVLGLWISVLAFRRAAETENALPEAFLKRPLQATYALTMLNPLTIVAFVGFASLYSGFKSPLLSAWYALCTGLGSLAIQLSLALGGAGLRHLLRTRRNARTLNFISGLGIVGFGFVGLLRECSVIFGQ